MNLAFDPGYGGIKLYGANGKLNMPSALAVASQIGIQQMEGLRRARPPLKVETNGGAFYVGQGAHDWGRPVENLDFDRLTGSPEMMALFLGAVTHYGIPERPTSLIVGLPIIALLGEQAGIVQRKVRAFLEGEHRWTANGKEHRLVVESVLITSQPVGAMFDYLLNEKGKMPVDRQRIFRGEIGILGIGTNTLDLLVVRNGKPVQRFTSGETLGVRRLLQLLNHDGLYSLAELDSKLRNHALDTSVALPLWQSEVVGYIERQWGSSFGRFDKIVMVGGGTILLRDALVRRFKERAFIPDDLIMSTARGLYKYTLMRASRGQDG